VVLVTAFLVFFMQAGFMALEAGFARSRESVNVLISCVFDTCVCRPPVLGDRFRVPVRRRHGFIGAPVLLPARDDTGLWIGGRRVPCLLLFPVRIRRHGIDGHDGRARRRTSFKGDIIYSIFVSGLIYPSSAHWAWGPGGWLGNSMGWFAGFVNNERRRAPRLRRLDRGAHRSAV